MRATPVTTRIVAVAWATADVGERVGGCIEELAIRAAERMIMSATNALSREW